MKIVTASLAALWLCLSFALPAHAADEFSGKWTLSKSRERGKVQFAMTFRSSAGGFSQHESDWPVTAFNVLDLTTEGKHEVTFFIERDVGRIECKGFIEGGAGIGAFTFKLSRKYLESMRSRGHGNADESEQFVMAVHDLSVNFGRTLKGENRYDSGTSKVVAFKRLDELGANRFNETGILQPQKIDFRKYADTVSLRQTVAQLRVSPGLTRLYLQGNQPCDACARSQSPYWSAA